MHVYPQDGRPDSYPRPRVTKGDIQEAAKLLGVTVVERPLQEGDLFLAGRNTGVKLLTVKHINPRNWIESKEGYYPYDTWECFAGEEIEQKVH